MIGHRTYLDPPRTSSVRCTEWIAPKKRGHRAFMLILPVKKEEAAYNG